MPGTRAQSKNIVEMVQGYSNAAVTANQYLWEFVSVCYARITGIKAYATTAGSGAGSTVCDVLVNGTSIWGNVANKPTLAAASTGEFANTIGDPGKVGIRPGDRVALQVITIPATTGHARLTMSVAIEGNS